MDIILGIKAEIAITTIFNRLAQCIALSAFYSCRGNAKPFAYIYRRSTFVFRKGYQ